MPWNPDKYNEFRNIRYQPFFDLMEMISGDGLEHAVDLGCGTGEQTRILAERFPDARFLGIDASAEMLGKSRELERENLSFRQWTVEEYLQAADDLTGNASKDLRRPSSKDVPSVSTDDLQGNTPLHQPGTSLQHPEPAPDLIFSNAALQWSDNHEWLFSSLIRLLPENGQLAVQMPCQRDNRLNQLLLELVKDEPFRTGLGGWTRDTPMLDIDAYTEILFENGLDQIQVLQKVYPIIADTPEKLYDFIAGSALIPYMERLPEKDRRALESEFKRRISRSFGKFPAIYAFKRLLLYGRKK